MNQQPNTRLVAIGVGVFVLIVIIIGIFFSVNRMGKVKVSIDVLPNDSTLFVNGKKVDKTVYLEPGTYTFAAKKDGFVDATSVMVISEENNTVTLLPEAQSDEAIRWRERSADQAIMESMGGKAADERGVSLRERYPLINSLPYEHVTDNFFSVHFGFEGDNNSSIYFIVGDANPAGRVDALNWIRSQNIEPTDLDIRFENFKNPLTGEVSYE